MMDMTSEAAREMDKRITRKMDIRILPLIIVSYLLNYLDRTNLGNARTLNADRPGESLVETLSLSGSRYNFVVAIFFVPYVLFEFPSGILLKALTPSRSISRIMISWGIVTMCTAAVTSYEGLIVCRIFLGICEAGFFPGILYYLTFWYPARQRAFRMGLFSASIAVAGAFGGLIASGVGELSGKGGLFGWQWLFILEGIPAILWGVVVLFFLPDFPDTAKFLSAEEREFAIARLGDGAPKMTDKHFDKTDAWNCIKEWQFWVFAIHYFCMANSLNAFGFFAPTIVASLGFAGRTAQLMTVPPNVFAFFVIIGNALHSDRTRERPMHILAGLALVMTGYLLLAVVGHWGVRYMGVMFIACTNAAVIPFIAYRSSTVTGATSTAIAMAGVIAISNTAGAVAPFLFLSKQSPRYITGNWTCFGLLGLSCVLTLILWWRLGGSSEYRVKSVVGEELDDERSVAGAETKEDKAAGVVRVQ